MAEVNESSTENIESAKGILTHLMSDTTNEYLSVAESNFLLPDMGDYMKDNADVEYLAKLDEKISGTAGSAYNAMFYREAPFTEALGYHKDSNAFVIKATPIVPEKHPTHGSQADHLNEFDGDTMYFDASTINDGGTSFEIGGSNYVDFKQYLHMTNASLSESFGRFGIRYLGIDCPEIPHYKIIPVRKDLFDTLDPDYIKQSDSRAEVNRKSALKIEAANYYQKVKTADLRGLPSLVWHYDHNATNRKNDEAIFYGQKDPKSKKVSWREIHDMDFTIYGMDPEQVIQPNLKEGNVADYQFISVVSSDETKEGDTNGYNVGMQAKENAKKMLMDAEDILIVIDAQGMNKASGNIPNGYNNNILETQNLIDLLTYQWNMLVFADGYNYQKLGYNMYGQDVYKRYLGVVYVKVKGEWINLNKYILAQGYPVIKALPDYTSDPHKNADYSYNSDAFRLWSYDPKGQKVIDSLEEMSKADYDDRVKLQQSLGFDTDKLKEWTVMIGDSVFMVPPTSIRVTTQTTTTKQPLLRAKGSMVKGAQRSQRLLELTLYFNDDAGINGIPYETTLPNGEKITYYLNGLRSLIAMFKTTPFLPIENSYINNTLNIEAITLSNLQITTVPNYPRCIAATLTLEEFFYRAYMPELPVPDAERGDDLNRNMFASCISFETMRWYYQQSIIRGNILKAQGLDVGSKEYIDATFGSKTVLQPMDFGDSFVNFYVINKAYLDQQKQLKLNSKANPASSLDAPTTDGGTAWGNALGQLYEKIMHITKGSIYQSALNDINYIIEDEKEDTSIKAGKITAAMNRFKNYMKTELTQAPLVLNVTYSDVIKEDTMNNSVHTMVMTIGLQCGISTTTDLRFFLNNIATKIAVNVEAEPFYDEKTNSITLAITANIKGKKGYYQDPSVYSSPFSFTNTSSLKFLKQCSNSYTLAKSTAYNATEAEDLDKLSPVTATDINTYLGDQKQSIDVETTLSLKFDKYMLDYDDLNIMAVSCSFGNTLSRISLQAQDGFSPQYTGGQDTTIELSMQTRSESNVALLNHLPRLAAMYARDYRIVLNCWPVRFDSHITRLFGINEVLIESLDVNTVAGHPGLFNINMRLIGVDRTLRNREALKKLTVSNNSGSTKKSNIISLQNKTFFDLKKTLSQAEVYPDLELPTIAELAAKGFKFIRYAGPISERTYPDPDFYFVYGHILGYEIFRSGIINYLKAGMLTGTAEKPITEVDGVKVPQFDIYDKTGAKITLEPRSTVGHVVVATNENADAQKAQKGAFIEATQGLDKSTEKVTSANTEASSHKEFQIKYGAYADASDVANVSAKIGVFESWNIASNKIKCIFREKKYIEMFKNSKENEWYINQLKLRTDKIIAAIDAEINNPITDLDPPFKAYCTVTREGKDTYTTTGRRDIKNTMDPVFQNGMGLSSNKQKTLEDNIDTYVNTFFSLDNKSSNGYIILEALGIPDEIKKKTRDAIKYFIKASASAATGIQEQDSGNPYWKSEVYNGQDSQGNLRPICSVDYQGQGQVGIYAASNLNDAIEKGIVFGPFAIRTYTKDEIKGLTGTSITSATNNRFFLDPYYGLQNTNKASDKEIADYKKGILMNPIIMTRAFIRNMLYWLKQMSKDEMILSIYGLIVNEAKGSLEKNTQVQEILGTETNEANKTTSAYPAAIETLQVQVTNSLFNLAIKTMEDSVLTEADKASLAVWMNMAIKANAFGFDQDMTPEFKKHIADYTAKHTGTQKANMQYAEVQKDQIELGKELKKMFDNNQVPMAVGQLFAPFLMALTDGDKTLYSLMENRNYEVLNSITQSAQTIEKASELNSPATRKFRRILKALAGYGYTDIASFGTRNTSDEEQMANLFNERIYIAAAENPAIYIQHSFYDMIVNDKRGRMLRAFPTYYMMFVDEGREIGSWKLHDNFYNMSAISEIQVVKSRKIAADTASITMSNMFDSYTTDDEDIKSAYNYTAWDAFDSIFSPRKYFLKEEAKREAQKEVNRVKLKPGARIHLRMGYGSDASELPIVFNGVVSQVTAGEAVELVCQGDGVELSNPLLSTVDAEDVQEEDSFIIGKLLNNWLTHGATPRTILGSLLTTKGGWLKKEINNMTDGRFFNNNPYGIVHFGEPKFTDVFKSGEVVQNIYEGGSKPAFGAESEISSQYTLKDAPKISTTVFGKSYWDLMHVCTSAATDYVTSIVPFGLRSSIFYGAPRFYCAYDYAKVDGVTKERRKPFQQFHIYTSYSDIISNSISASDREVKTCAVGMYSSSRWLGRDTTKRVGPMWADFDIYPEKQKTMTVDTQYLAKGSALGDIIPFMNMLQDEFSDGAKGISKLEGGHQIAWRMTANALKDSVMDMYQGELTVIGDPSIKPYDKVWIEDSYERMQGSFQAEAVVHTLSAETGFTTSIYADCITTIDDRHEQITQSMGSHLAARIFAPYLAIIAATWGFAGSTKPILSAMGGMLHKGGQFADDAIKGAASLIGKEGMESGFANKIMNAGGVTGVKVGRTDLDNAIARFTGWRDSMAKAKFGSATNLNELANSLDKFTGAIDDLDPEKMIAEMEKVKAGISKPKDIEALDKAIAEVREAADNMVVNGAKQTSASTVLSSVKGLDQKDIDFLVRNLTSTQELIDANYDIAMKIKKLPVGKFNSPADMKILSEALRIVKVPTAEADEAAKLLNLFRKTGAAGEGLERVTIKLLADSASGSFISKITSSKSIASLSNLALGAKTAAMASAVALMAEFAIVQVMTSFAYEYVERWAKNLRVLQVFPLKKDGMVMTAGLDGSNGIVYGSPTWNDSGVIGSWLVGLLGPHKGFMGGVAEGVIDLFASADFKEIVAKFMKKEEIVTDMSPGESTLFINDLLKATASDEMLNGNKYRSMLMRSRIDKFKSEDGKIAISQYAITDIDGYDLNKEILENMVPVASNVTIQKMVADKKFKFLADTLYKEYGPADPKLNWVIGQQKFNVNSTVVEMRTIKEKLGDSYTYDVPFLRPEAFYLLIEIIDRLRDELEPVTSLAGAVSGFIEHPVILKSALRVGDNSIAATGYSFKLNVVGYNKLGELIRKIEAKERAFVEGVLGEARALFVYREIGAGGDNYEIVVYPPKIKVIEGDV
jgi:hypothetical protein